MDSRSTVKSSAISKNRHSCYILKYHLVVVTKYQHPVLTGDMENRLYEIINKNMEDWGCTLISAKSDQDHVHVLFEAPPQVQLSKLVNNFKTVTSRLLRKEFPDILDRYYWKDVLWSRSYFIGCVSDVTEAIVDEYIKLQGTKPRKYRKKNDGITSI